MSECILKNKVSHAKAKEQFRNTLFFCRLFEEENIGMNTLGVICGHCCLKVQRIGEFIAMLVLQGIINYEQFDREPRCFAEYLPEDLKEYVDCVADISGRDWEFMRGICNRCNAIPVNPQEIPKTEATKMSNVAKREA